jgi:hypothetical protein
VATVVIQRDYLDLATREEATWWFAMFRATEKVQDLEDHSTKRTKLAPAARDKSSGLQQSIADMASDVTSCHE